jgi:hypothetical protein
MNSAEQQIREQLDATERANSQLLHEIKQLNAKVSHLVAQAVTDQMRDALKPFLAMARACATLHDHEPIAARAVNGGNNRVVHLDVSDFRALANAVDALDGERSDSDEIALAARINGGSDGGD